jgi:hypothetical protein
MQDSDYSVQVMLQAKHHPQRMQNVRRPVLVHLPSVRFYSQSNCLFQSWHIITCSLLIFNTILKLS